MIHGHTQTGGSLELMLVDRRCSLMIVVVLVFVVDWRQRSQPYDEQWAGMADLIWKFSNRFITFESNLEALQVPSSLLPLFTLPLKVSGCLRLPLPPPQLVMTDSRKQSHQLPCVCSGQRAWCVRHPVNNFCCAIDALYGCDGFDKRLINTFCVQQLCYLMAKTLTNDLCYQSAVSDSQLVLPLE